MPVGAITDPIRTGSTNQPFVLVAGLAARGPKTESLSQMGLDAGGGTGRTCAKHNLG